MSGLARGKSPEIKLITLFNMNLPRSQSQQSFRVNCNTTIFDLMNHLEKYTNNQEIELFISSNQPFKGSPNSFLFPMLQQGNIRTIYYKAKGDSQQSLTKTSKQPYDAQTNNGVPNAKSQYNYVQESPYNQSMQQMQIEQQNQSQFQQQSAQQEFPLYNGNMIGGINLSSQSQTNQQQIFQLKQENLNLSKALTFEKEQNLELQKQIVQQCKSSEEQIKQLQQQLQQQKYLQQSYNSSRDLNEQIKQLNYQLEKERSEKEDLKKQIIQLKETYPVNERLSIRPKENSQNEISPLKSSIFDKSSPSSINPERLSSTTVMDQSRVQYKLSCYHYMKKNEIEQILKDAMSTFSTALCRMCSKPISLAICRLLDQIGSTYIDYKCKLDLKQIQSTLQSKQTLIQCGNRACSFFCCQIPISGATIGFCPQCLQFSVKIPLTTFIRKEYNPQYTASVKNQQYPSTRFQISAQNQNQSDFIPIQSRNSDIKILEVKTAMISQYNNYSNQRQIH